MTRLGHENQDRSEYHLSANGNLYSCCRQTFMTVHRITPDVIKTIHRAQANNEFVIVDHRGIHQNRPKRVTDELKEQMLNHIHRFPKFETHYARRNYPSHYLHPDLSVERMFRKFQEHYPDVPNSKKWLYREQFNATNLKFGCHKMDTCKRCDFLHVQIQSAATREEIEKFEHQKFQHLHFAESAQNALKDDIQMSKNRDDLTVKIVDLQQVKNMIF